MKVLRKDVNQRIGQAMHAYDMLHDGDRVMVAVSGGVDSLVLVWLLNYWRGKAPIDYEVTAVHLDLGFDGGDYRVACFITHQLEKLNIPLLVEKTDFGKKAIEAENGKSVCFHCSRQRRNRLFEMAREMKFNKIALGHHKDDILETFFLNLFYSGNISTMTPRQDLFDGGVSIIRPLAFIEKDEIWRIAVDLGIEPVKNPCGRDGDSKRQEVRDLLASIHQTNPKIKANIFASLKNIRQGYLL